MFVTTLATIFVAAAPLAGPPAVELHNPQQSAVQQPAPLAAAPLAAGQQDRALAILMKAAEANPHDPAVLINLGIAHAHRGDDAKARAAFEAALTCHETVELTTADGSETDSRRLARKAIRMLERGEFATAEVRAGQLTMRD